MTSRYYVDTADDTWSPWLPWSLDQTTDESSSLMTNTDLSSEVTQVMHDLDLNVTNLQYTTTDFSNDVTDFMKDIEFTTTDLNNGVTDFINDLEFTATDFSNGVTDFINYLEHSRHSDTSLPDGEPNYYLHLASVIYYALTIPLAIGGNMLILVTVVRQRSLHKPAFYYVCNLAVGDVMFASLCSPIYTLNIAYGRVIAPGWICQIHAFLTQVYAFQVRIWIVLMSIKDTQEQLHEVAGIST